jgi:hypothetical protein
MKIYFNENGILWTRSIDLDLTDFSCRSGSKVLDLKGTITGQVSQNFLDYNSQVNKVCVSLAFDGLPVSMRPPQAMINQIAAYPDTAQCTEQ